MTVKVTLRYLTKTVNLKTDTFEVPEGCTAGTLAADVIRAEETSEGLSFENASIVTMVNGRVVPPEHVLECGDEMKVFPVAAAG